MTYIERLLRGVEEKNIFAKPRYGNFKIDIDYRMNGVRYTLSKKDKKIALLDLDYRDTHIRIIDKRFLTERDFIKIIDAVSKVFPNHTIEADGILQPSPLCFARSE